MAPNSYLRKKSYRLFFIFFQLIMLVFSVRCVNAQGVSNEKITDVQKSLERDKFSIASFNVALLAGITQKAAFNRMEGFYKPEATMQPYWQAGAEYQLPLKKKYSFIVGLHATMGGRNTIFDAPAKKINPEGYPDSYILKNNNFDVGLSLPLLLEKHWNVNHLKGIYIQGGIEVHYSLGYSHDSYGEVFNDVNGNFINIFSMNLNANNYNKPWITYALGGGVERLLANNNILKIGFKANLSFTHFIQGSYEINIPGDPLTQGTYSVTGSYIGIAASYCFTGLNQKIVRIYEKQGKKM